ncbi:MAG: peptidoglycan-binding protein [Nitrosomonadales bacterium]|nr:peptidoglycan-binding protein [Nitrosomonadales bacterium]
MTPLRAHPRAIYRVIVDGRDISAIVHGRLISLTLTDNRGFEADQLDLVLDDSDGKLDLPPRGAEVSLAIGWEETGLVDKGLYTVDEVSHSGAPDQLTLRARSADLRNGLTTQRERSWHLTTLRDIVNTIATENDLTPVIASSLAGQFIEHLDQTNESSANLLTRLARDFDAIATVKNGRLLFMPAAGGVSASGKPLPAITITRRSGDQHHFSIADRDTYSAVKATYYNTSTGVKGEVIWGKAEDDAEHKRQPATPAAEPATGKYKPLSKVSKNREAARRLAQKTWKAMTRAQRAGYIGVKSPYQDRNLNVSGEVAYGEADERLAHQHAVKLAKSDAAKIGSGSSVLEIQRLLGIAPTGVYDEPTRSAVREYQANHGLAVDGIAGPKTMAVLRSGQPAAGTSNNAIDRSADNLKTLRHVYANAENAKRAARAEWRRLQRGMAEFSINLAQGRPELIPDQPASVQGFKPAIDNTDWILIKVTHFLTENGLTTQLALEIRATEIPG